MKDNRDQTTQAGGSKDFSAQISNCIALVRYEKVTASSESDRDFNNKIAEVKMRRIPLFKLAT